MSNTFFDLSTLSISQLAAVYNAVALVKVNKFSTKPLALKRIEKLCEEQNLHPVNVDGEPLLVKRPAEELPQSRFDVGAPGKVNITEAPEDREPPAVEPIAPAFAAAAEKPPATAVKTVPTPYEIQQAKKARRSRKPVADAVAATGSQRSDYAESQVITVLKAPAARDGSNRAARAAALKSGMTVGAYLDAAHKAHAGKERARHRFHSDIARYVEAGFISIK